MRNCPPESKFAELDAGTLPEAEIEALELHAERCSRCAAALVEAVNRDLLVERLRDLERTRRESEAVLSSLPAMEETATRIVYRVS